MSRLPLRLRVTLVFALAMAAVLAATGLFLYVRVGDALVAQVDDSLRARAAVIAAAIRTGELDEPLAGGEEEFAQAVAPHGDVVAATPGFEQALLSAAERAAVGGGRFFETEVSLPGEDEAEPARLLALPVGDGLVVVGASLEDRAEALDELLAQLAVGGPLALLLASLAGYALAGAALRPVDAMRRRAEEISADTTDRRLPLPAARDEVFALGTTLNAMLDRLDAALRRERRFVADASHELRTPLALLRTELELAGRRERTREELEAALASASEDVERLARLADDLLVLAAGGGGELPLRAEPLPVRELVEGVARRFARRAAEAGRRIETSADGGSLVGDRLRLEQALGNLVDNALRHGEGTIRIEADASELRVRDEGPGFPPEFAPHAFEPFTRADEARSSGGAGLGLAIVAAVARAHGGSVRAETGAGGGAVVTLVLGDAA